MLDENGRPILYCEKCGRYPSITIIDVENSIPHYPDCNSALTRVRYIED